MRILSEVRPEFDFEGSEDFIEDGYLDSFDVVTLVSEIEEEFGVIIDGMDVVPENFDSVASIIKMIEKSEKTS